MKFEDAYKKLIKFEGGYVNDPDDKGGETYKGIARNYHPDWSGWKVIDALKPSENFPKMLDSIYALDKAVQQFYKTRFWDAFEADSLPYLIAVEIFEIAVNTGIMRATTILQTACNLLNRKEKFYPNIIVDGKFGNITNNIIHNCIEKNGEILVYNVLNILQGAFYVDLMLKNELYEKYIGWFSRIEIRREQ